jgi:hypothetical protein
MRTIDACRLNDFRGDRSEVVTRQLEDIHLNVEWVRSVKLSNYSARQNVQVLETLERATSNRFAP